MTKSHSANMRLSVSMALDALSEQVELVHSAEATLEQQRSQRDEMIRDAQEAGIGMPRLARITGLSRNRLWTIVNSGRTARSLRAERDA